METWFSSHHLWRLYRDGAAFFKLASLGDGEAFYKDSSLEMDTWFSSHHLWRLYRDGAAFFKLASPGDVSRDESLKCIHLFEMYPSPRDANLKNTAPSL